MEGTCKYPFPRTSLDKPVELQIGRDTILIESPETNVSAGGLFVCRTDLPVGRPIHVRIGSQNIFEADGQVRGVESRNAGMEIEFASLSSRSREALMELIEDLTRRGLPAA